MKHATAHKVIATASRRWFRGSRPAQFDGKPVFVEWRKFKRLFAAGLRADPGNTGVWEKEKK